MLRRIITIILVILISALLTVPAFAQDYYFSLDKEVVNVYWNSDGTLALDYLLTFTNQPGGHSIEFVDVGMPNGNFDFNSIRADVNGSPLSISHDFQGSGSDGFAVEMGRHAIPPGETGTVHVFVGSVSQVLHKDDQDSDYASAVFAPLYFQSNVITGTTDITVTYHLPPGVQPNEPRWHAAPAGFPSEPQTAVDPQGRLTYTWQNPNASGSRQYTFGASFPKKYVPSGSIVTVNIPSFSVSPGAIFSFFCLALLGFMFLGVPILSAVAGSRRKLQYLPPRISIEGHGIKRGLTAVEAAILLGEPLDKVMTMILFGVIKKNAAQVSSRDPLQVDVTDPMPGDLHEYERTFLLAFREPNAQTRRNLLQEMTVKLVRSVSEKMKGFSRRETIEYYKNIMEKAWQQVEQADTPEVKSELFDKNLEWTMLDRDYNDRTRRVFTGPVFMPMWWPRYDPTFGRSIPTSRGSSSPSSTPSMPSVPRLPGADFAASVAVGMQTFSQRVIGNVTDFTTRVTNVTNPPPKPSAGSYGGRPGGGGGRSCACACACAGCACACAGGGR
ncbi:MAG TPA: hypothetical protein VK909_05465 [Anaerolineales bacterium]|nr:hypothetical protein [Anaerolineales bacterium]